MKTGCAWSATWWSTPAATSPPTSSSPAVMRSHARMTYTEVAAVLGNTRGPEAQRRSALVPHLIHLHEVYRALFRRRGTRGAVDFETTETQIVCDDNGRIERIVPRTRNEAHRLIEEAMLAANVCAAEFIQERTPPGAVPRARRPDAGEAHDVAELPAHAGPGPAAERGADAGRTAGHRAGHARAARRHADPRDAASVDAAGALHGGQQRALRPGLRRLHPLHESDPALPRPAGAPGHQGAAAQPALSPRRRRPRRAGRSGAWPASRRPEAR